MITPPESTTNSSLLSKIRGIGSFHTLGLILIFILMSAIMSLISDSYMSMANVDNLLRQTSIYAVLAIGVTFVIITGGIDLSIGSVVGFTSVVAALLLKQGYPISVTIMVTLLVGVLIGIVNGLCVVKFGLPPFIATLAGLVGYAGLSLVLTRGSIIAGLPQTFTKFSSSKMLAMPNLFWVTVGVLVVCYFVLHRSRFGRHLYASGSNPEAARLSGVNVSRVIIGSYVMSALLASIAGLMTLSRIAVGSPVTGKSWELEAIASSVIGGTSLFGAIGNVFGPFFGALILSTIKNACNLLGVNSYYQQIITALLIVAIVYLDNIRRRRKS